MTKTDDSSSYFQMIAEYVRRKRISPMLLSSSEGQILLEWERKGVPLDIALDSIDKAYEKFLRADKNKKRRGFRLDACKTLVLKEWKKFIQFEGALETKAYQKEDKKKSLQLHFQLIKEGVAGLKEQKDKINNIDRITDNIISGIESVQKDCEKKGDIEDTIERLKRLDDELVEQVVGNLKNEVLEEGALKVKKVLENYVEKMDKVVYDETYQSVLKDWVRRKLSLPAFILPYQILMELSK